ncbi:hypothetical protein [Kutzneria sp. NPDC051319]|uniref:hypothetical protein n=1 Tax=Kutzneria sp. NPDC051319 TaxID=3155047 RepID=UPI0034333672
MSITRWAVAALLTVTFGAVPALAHAAPSSSPTPPGTSRPHSALPSQQSLAGKFVPVAPKRLLDTRDGTGAHGRVAPLGPGSSLPLDVSDITGNPSVSATAVVLNVTVTNATQDSFVSVSASNFVPSVSSINFRAGQTVPNLVTAPLYGDVNTVFLFNHAGTADVIADIFGYYTTDRPGGSLTTVAPTRILDTRDGIGAVGPGATLPLQVTGRNSVPATGVTAVQLNVTVTGPTASSFLSVFPSGGAPPNVSNLNFTAGQTVANAVIVPLGPDGRINFFNLAGRVDVVADISGYFTANTPGTLAHGGVYETLATPTRVLDTRSDGGPVAAGQSRALTVSGLHSMDQGKPTAVVLNLTVASPTADGFVTAYPNGSATPNASNVNFMAGQTLSNLVVVPVGPDGKVAFYNRFGRTDLVVDMFGYFQAGPDLGIESLAFAQSTVDATNGSAAVDLTWTVTDSNTNVNVLAGDLVLRRKGSQPDTYLGQSVTESFSPGGCCGSATFVSGDAHRSTYTYRLYVPPVSDSATTHWVVSEFALTDDLGNHLLAVGSDLDGYPGAVLTATTVAGSKGPTYQTLEFGTVFDKPYLYSGVTNTAVYHIDPQDQAEDFWRGSITVSGPGGASFTKSFAQAQVNGQHLDSPCQDFHNEDSCAVSVVFPKGSAPGRWVVSKVVLTSNAGTTAVYDNLAAAPITVTDNIALNASGFRVTPDVVDNWRSAVDVSLTMRANRSEVSTITVDADCGVLSSTPTANPDGSYTIPLRIYQGSSSCTISGIALADAAGNVALYGKRYLGTPDPGLVVNRIPDTTPPSVSSVSVSPATIPASQQSSARFFVTVHAAIGLTAINGYSEAVYDAAGKVVGQSVGGVGQAADGTVKFEAYLSNPVPPGVYTIGFSLSDDGRLTTAYGPPNGKPMPGGPLTITVTEG